MTKTFIQHLLENEPMAPLQTFTATFNDNYGIERTMTFKARSLEDADKDAKMVAKQQGWQMPGLEQTDSGDGNHVYNNPKPEYEFDASAFGRSSEEEEEPKIPAIRDQVKGHDNYPDERGAEPSIKRAGQRARRRLGKVGRGNPSKNAMDYYTPNELHRGEEEEETKKQARRDRQITIDKWIKDTEKPVPLSRMRTQENRIKRRLYGK